VEVETRLLGFQEYYQSLATPFAWHFTRSDLTDLLKKLDPLPLALARVA
jgi:hypothetical protein